MKCIALLSVIACLLTAPAALFAQTENHFELGAFGDYFRYDQTGTINFAGVGGRAAFYVNPYTSIEGEFAYDFARNSTFTTSNGITTNFVTTNVRPITALFGPKFNLGTGNTHLFVTGKVGFINFASSNFGFAQSVANIPNGTTRFAMYPGVGVESFLGPIGLRAEIGDRVYFLDGARNNLSITFGPHFRF
jgi:Outer membrane protein beta-barrel domain